MRNIKINSKLSKILIILLLAFFVIGKTALLVHSVSHNLASSANINGGSQECSICELAHLQNQISFAPKFAPVFLAFFLLFLARYFSSLKLSHLFSSKFSRAPPIGF